MLRILQSIHALVWGIPTVCLIVCVGIRLTWKTRLSQIRLLPRALRCFFSPEKKADIGSVTPFQALCTALAATVGTGNIAGVAGAIALGGPGAVFWMWISALFGMVIKCAEATLAIRYRSREEGQWVGGTMYMIRNAMSGRWAPMALVYSFFGVIAAFGVGNATQINAVLTGIHTVVDAAGGTYPAYLDIFIGIGLAVVIFLLLRGGMGRIGKVAQILVPAAAAGYLLLGLWVLLMRCAEIPDAFRSIVVGAFTPRAVTGGGVGSFFMAVRTGVSRGIFTNEAGMGTAAMAHAGADVSHPAQQGLLGIVEVFLDTIVICTMTALVILVSGIPVSYGCDAGAALTIAAFCEVCGPWVSIAIALALSLFAIATVLGWGLYGIRCTQYLFGNSCLRKFLYLQAGAVVLGAMLSTGSVWLMSEIVNGLMAVPNCIALWALGPEFFRLMKEYES